MSWDACSNDPSSIIRWIECHPASSSAAQAFVGLLAIGVALWAATLETRNIATTRREYERKLASALEILNGKVQTLIELHNVEDEELTKDQCAHIANVGKSGLAEIKELASLISEIIEISRLSSFEITRAIVAVRQKNEAAQGVFGSEDNWLNHPTKSVIRSHIGNMAVPLAELQSSIKQGLDVLNESASWVERATSRFHELLGLWASNRKYQKSAD